MMNFYEGRKFVILGSFFLIGVVYLLRLFYIQVMDESYTLSAKNQALRHVTQYPARGLIYDRKGEILVYNEAAYDLMVTPGNVKEMDTMAFCELIGIEREDFIKKISKAKKFSWHKASVFERQISADAFAVISEKLYKYPGFFGQKRTLRKYPKKIAPHVLGYINEVDKNTLKEDTYYERGDYIGASGIECAYETDLRGKRGVRILMVDVYNRLKGSYQQGKYDTVAEGGSKIISTLDADLQEYGEKLMKNKTGSIVAIEPATGEVLVLLSAPGYDPNLLSGRKRTKHYNQLVRNDSLKPLFNRAVMAPYPPGSIFKMVQALVALQEGVITTQTGFQCNKSLVGCHNHPSSYNLKKGIQYSCNPYFYNVVKKILNQGASSSIFKDTELGLAKWRKHILTFGFGKRLGLDIPNEKSGNVPGVALYDRVYGAGRWAYSTIYSISIGQGELEVVPLQMANLAAIIANRGYYYKPHLVKAIGENQRIKEEYKIKHYTSVASKHFELVVDAMQAVVDEPHGTARRARIDGIEVCGKTGTAENPHGEDHSVFIAFAPKANPKIAIAVYVENSGFGGTWAAPIASLMIEKYLTDSISDPEKEKRILEADFIHPEKEDQF